MTVHVLLEAIRDYCLLCEGTRKRIKECTSVDCPLRKFRPYQEPTAGKQGKAVAPRPSSEARTGSFLDDWSTTRPVRPVASRKQHA